MGEEKAQLRVELLRWALVADALGAPLNGLKHGHIQQLAGGQVEGFLSAPLYPEKPEKNPLPRLHTSVGQRLLAALAWRVDAGMGRDPLARVGEALKALGGEEEPAGQRLGSLRQCGRPLRRAVLRWREEFPWDADQFRAESEPSEGISPAVLGISAVAMGLEDPPAAAAQMARLTHVRLMPVMAAAAVAWTLERCLDAPSGKKFDAVSLGHELLEWLRPEEDAYVRAHSRLFREQGWGTPTVYLTDLLAPLPSLLREENDDLAIRTIVNTAQQAAPDHPVTHVQQGFTGASLCWALYRGLGPMPGGMPIIDVLNRGGEVSAVGAIVAALLVARRGSEALPEEWRGGQEALDLAAALLRDPSEETLERWLGWESAMTQKELRHQKPLQEERRRQEKLDQERGRAKPKKPAKPDPVLPNQEDAPFAPPPEMWLKPGDEEDPRIRRKLKAARGKKRIEWKEERRKGEKP